MTNVKTSVAYGALTLLLAALAGCGGGGGGSGTTNLLDTGDTQPEQHPNTEVTVITGKA